MTVNTTPVEISYTGDASTTVFALPFAFAANAHVKVYLGGVLQNSGYSITGAGNPSGGTLTFSAAPGSGVAIKARRVTPLTQEIDVVNNATVFASSLETGLDYALLRQQEEAFDRVQLGITFAIDAAAVDADAAAAAASAAAASVSAASALAAKNAAETAETNAETAEVAAEAARDAAVAATVNKADRDGSNLTGTEPADFRTAINAVGVGDTLSIVAANGVPSGGSTETANLITVAGPTGLTSGVGLAYNTNTRFQRQIASFTSSPDGAYWDIVSGWGTNLTSNFNKANPNFNACSMRIEQRYYETAQLAWGSEFQIGAFLVTGSGYRAGGEASLFYGFIPEDAANRASSFLQLGGVDQLSIVDFAGLQSLKFQKSGSNPQILMLNSSSFWQTTNNVPLLKQLNAAADTYLDLIKLNARDEMEFGTRPIYLTYSGSTLSNNVVGAPGVGFTQLDQSPLNNGSFWDARIAASPVVANYKLFDIQAAATTAVESIRSASASGASIYDRMNCGTGGGVFYVASQSANPVTWGRSTDGRYGVSFTNGSLEPADCTLQIDRTTNKASFKGPVSAPLELLSQTGTTYTLALTDAAGFLTLANAAAIAVTIPTNATVAFPLGTKIEGQQGGAGVVTFSGAGVTINSRGALLSTAGQWAVWYLVKTATDTWTLTGDLA